MAASTEGCVTLVPCNGSSDNINLRILQANIPAWQALVGSRVQLNGTYGPAVWYVESVILSNDPAFGPDCTAAQLAPSFSTITVVGIGECSDAITSTNCCALVTNCVTTQVLNVVLGETGSAEYLNWETLIDHLITIDNENYPGTWHVDGLCCMNAVVDPCTNVTACALGGIALDFATVSDQGEDVCPPNIYKLTNCQTKLSIYTETNLYTYLGSVISIVEYPGCWSVYTEDQLVQTQEVTLIEGYDDCLCCLEPIPEKYTRVIPKPDKAYYQITQSQCDIKANVRFGEGYYRLFKKLKYGIDSACDNIDLDKLWIKKNLSDLAVINNPAECIITTPVKPVVCPEPPGNPYIPPVPPVTYSFTIASPGIDPGSFSCGQCFDGTPVLPGELCPQFNMVLDYNILDTIDPVSQYVFTYGLGCVWAWGFTIVEGADPALQTYTIPAENIASIVVGEGDPCTLCGT